MTIDDQLMWLGVVVGLILLVLIIIKIRSFFKLATEICHQTLKGKDGKWSMTKIMMVAAFHLCAIVFLYDAFKNGKANEWAFGMMLTVAVTGGVASAYSKKIDPTTLIKPDENNPPT